MKAIISSLRHWSSRGRATRTLLAVTLLASLSVTNSAKAWWDGDWSYRKKITVDTSPKGGALAADAGRIPVLIRLHDGNFKFTDAKDDGSDLRFVAGDDKTPLKFHLDTYDGLLGVALVWIDVPNVSVAQPTDIWMYWGNPKAVAGGDPRGTYDADTTAVYHFGEKDAPPLDTTANANNATSPARTIDTGLIGRAAHLDGTAPILLPATPSLTILQNAQFSWSGWVKSDAPANGVVFSKHDGQNALLIGFEQGVPYVSVNAGSGPVRGNATAPISAAQWHHIAIAASDHVSLYVDGKEAAAVAGALPALGGAGALGGDVGAAPAVPIANAPVATPVAPAPAIAAAGFVGDLDEVELSKVARSPVFFAAAVASQSPESHMLVYGADEENAGLSGGYFGVILRSVTIDGWVVIGILGVMFAVAVMVMVNKAIYINRVARANAPFLDLFTRYGANIDELKLQVQAADDHRMDASVLYHVYRAMDEELERRRHASKASYLILGAPAMATIRANLDRIAAQEADRLSSQMVLLTIAISGGPFLGLLGTVVGVMITFAAIAASGDVNVNAIAPGIAAALVATVAGLAVAIPSLFGYNYLIARIKNVTSEMHGFSEELVTRLGETYSVPPAPERLAAE